MIRTPRKKVICPVCGKEFEIRITENKSTCSVKCRYIFVREKLVGKVKTPEQIERSRLAHMGLNYSNKGKTYSDIVGEEKALQWKLKQSVSSKGKKKSSDHCKKIGLSRIGRKWSEESIEKRTKTRSENTKKRGYYFPASHIEKLKSKEHLSKVLHACCRRPNKFEFQALDYLNHLYTNKFKYTGNGTLIVNGRSADAYSEELNTIALFHGYYWHLKRNGLEVTKENKAMVELKDSKPFIDAGYKVILIWEDELVALIRDRKYSDLKEKIIQ